jgi:hypothetical protein
MLIHKRPIGTVAYLGGVPALLEKFSWAFLNMALYSNEYLCSHNSSNATYINYDRSKVSAHAKARNELVQSMKGNWLLQLDTDHEPPPDLLARMLNLLNKYNIEVLVGIYQVRKYPYPPLLYQWSEDHTEFELMASFDNPNKAEIFQVAAAGGGCLLVRRNVFYRIITELKCMPFDIMIHPTNNKPLSEDLSFFYRCRTLEIPCFAAANIESPHLDIIPITLEANRSATDDGFASENKIVEGYKIPMPTFKDFTHGTTVTEQERIE